MLGWRPVVTSSPEEFRSASGPKLSYSAGPIDGAYHVPVSGALDRGHAPMDVPIYARRQGMVVLYPLADERFDVFASIFHLLSLAEEYAIEPKDEHGRITSSALSLVANHLEHTPVVDQWALWLAHELRTMFPDLPPPARSYRHVLSVDVDNGLKYAARSWYRTLGAAGRDLIGGRGQQFTARSRVVIGAEPDPFLRVPEQLAAVHRSVDRCIAFLLMRGEQANDHAARPAHPLFKALVRDLRKHAELGLHPSYESSRQPERISMERELLSSIAVQPVDLSRQHFLRWSLPATLRELVALGFTEDHTLGFSDRPGFRAGTCTPFPWYDLEREQETALVLWPFACMDSALHEKVGLDPDAALDEFKRMADAVRAVNGTFVSVWHDRYLSGDAQYAAWPEVMKKLVEHARS
jgi:hypothetical protein